MRLKRTSNSELLDLSASAPLGQGGEARVFTVPGDGKLVAKVYHRPTTAHARKLQVMLANPPLDPMRAKGEVSIAWPLDLLKTPDGIAKTAGYLMHRVRDRQPVMNFYHPGARRKNCPLFHYQYLLRTARNLAGAVSAIHAKGYVIGDVNESNVLVSTTTLVTLVDTDSFQVRNPLNGDVFRCTVGKPEFTPPELQDKSFHETDRLPEHDLFGLGTLFFMLLMEGTHPFDGVYANYDNPPLREQRIAMGHFPYGNGRRPNTPKPSAPAFSTLHPTLRQLFLRCFEDGHSNPKARPDALTWHRALSEAENSLVSCKTNSQHRYFDHLKTCPWCERTQILDGRDPFPSKLSVSNQTHNVQPAKRPSTLSTASESSGGPQGSYPPAYSSASPSASQPAVQIQTLPAYSFPLIPMDERIGFVVKFSVVQMIAVLLGLLMKQVMFSVTPGILHEADPFRNSLYQSAIVGVVYGLFAGGCQWRALSQYVPGSAGWMAASCIGGAAGIFITLSERMSGNASNLSMGIVMAVFQAVALSRFIRGAWGWAAGLAAGSLMIDFFSKNLLDGQLIAYLPALQGLFGGLFGAIALSITRRK